MNLIIYLFLLIKGGKYIYIYIYIWVNVSITSCMNNFSMWFILNIFIKIAYFKWNFIAKDLIKLEYCST